jgi:hypothetical protein
MLWMKGDCLRLDMTLETVIFAYDLLFLMDFSYMEYILLFFSMISFSKSMIFN